MEEQFDEIKANLALTIIMESFVSILRLNDAAYCWNGGCLQSSWLEKNREGDKSFDTRLESKERSHGSRSISSRRLSSVRKESCRKNVLLTSFRLHYIVHSHRGRSHAGHGSWSFCFLRHSHNGNGLWNPMYTRWDQYFRVFSKFKRKKKKYFRVEKISKWLTLILLLYRVFRIVQLEKINGKYIE